MDDLFVHMLQDIYYAEKEILKALPTMIEKATNPQLRFGFEQHLAETRNHVDWVEEVFEMHGVEPQTVNCPAINGIIKEADEVASDVDNKQVLDAALIAVAQAVEHYEITRYGALVSWAKQLGRSDCASVLHHNLEEEKAADQKLIIPPTPSARNHGKLGGLRKSSRPVTAAAIGPPKIDFGFSDLR